MTLCVSPCYYTLSTSRAWNIVTSPQHTSKECTIYVIYRSPNLVNTLTMRKSKRLLVFKVKWLFSVVSKCPTCWNCLYWSSFLLTLWTNFPILCFNFPAAPVNGVDVFQLIRVILERWFQINDFIERNADSVDSVRLFVC